MGHPNRTPSNSTHMYLMCIGLMDACQVLLDKALFSGLRRYQAP